MLLLLLMFIVNSNLTWSLCTSVPLMVISGPDAVEHRVYLPANKLPDLVVALVLVGLLFVYYVWSPTKSARVGSGQVSGPETSFSDTENDGLESGVFQTGLRLGACFGFLMDLSAFRLKSRRI